MELWGSAEVTKLVGGPFSKEQVKERLAREISNMSAYKIQYWPMFLLSSGEFVGCCGLKPYKSEQKVYEIGFYLMPAYWGQGFASEAACAVVEYAFSTLKASALFAGHHPANRSSQHVPEKLGLSYTHDEFYAPTGSMHLSYFLSAEVYAKRH